MMGFDSAEKSYRITTKTEEEEEEGQHQED
jgi:hypothetical protein